MAELTPKPNKSLPVWELVIEDMRDRDRIGRERYGMPLQANNGRIAILDAYEEVLDLAVYLRQHLEEQSKRAIVDWGPWIPCSERLPKHTGTSCLVWHPESRCTFMAYIDENKDWYLFAPISRERPLKGITHWMERPPAGPIETL